MVGVRTMELRPYQEQCLAAVRAAYRAGRRRVLVSLPTGTGKTVVFAHFPEFFAMKRRLLVLAHREELLEQARAKFEAAQVGLSVDIEQGSRHASENARVVIASVASLGRKHDRRLARLCPDDFYLIVVDEAHHAIAPTYRRIFEHFGLFESDTRRMLVGFTATPYRGDGRGLGEVFEDIVFARGIREMIGAGFLCRVRGWRVSTGVDLDAVRIRRGDFVESQLASTIDIAERNAAIIRARADFAPGRRTIVFCVNVEHSHSVAAAFRRAGVNAAAVWGAMPGDDRRATLRSFAEGSIEVLTNCNVLTEGFDEPRIGCVVMARPTQSQLLYAQMVGRGTRLHSEKDALVVIDIVDNTAKHRLAGLQQLFDLPAGLDLRGHDALTIAERVEDTQARLPWVDVSRVADVETLAIAAERIDLLELEPPAEVRPHSSFAWHSTAAGDYRLALPHGERLVLVRNLLGSWDVALLGAEGRTLLERQSTLEAAIARGDAFVETQRKDARKLVDVDAPWRRREPTERQQQLLGQLQIPVPASLNRGQASWIIALADARRRA